MILLRNRTEEGDFCLSATLAGIDCLTMSLSCTLSLFFNTVMAP
jgi:hypothetical protein